MSLVFTSRVSRNGQNKLLAEDKPVHDWYRFVLSFPPHLVRQYLNRFDIGPKPLVLDPFCGTGTTLVECKKQGIPSVGIEANPVAHFASQVKVNWDINPNDLMAHATHIKEIAFEKLRREGIADVSLADLPLFQDSLAPAPPLRTLSPDASRLLLTDSISPLPLHKTLALLECLTANQDEKLYAHELLALAKALVCSISNLEFGPEVGVGPAKYDAPVVETWFTEVQEIAHDVETLWQRADTPAIVYRGDARQPDEFLAPASIDAVFTSPPYPNEKDYTRTTRLEAVLLGFVKNKADLRTLKRELVRSNTRGVYKEDNDDAIVAMHPEIQRIAEAIEERRLALGKTSGFERLYARVTKLYFGGMSRHLANLRACLRPGARLAYVVGDQASYLRVMIRTGQLLADIAQSLGYKVVGIDLFRTRLATATREQLREEVVILQWPG